MPRVNLVWYQPTVRRVMKDVKALKRREIAEIKGISHQAVSESILNGKMENDLTNWIQILYKSGWELKEREE